jgi:uncharacterized membrane protein
MLLPVLSGILGIAIFLIYCQFSFGNWKIMFEVIEKGWLPVGKSLSFFDTELALRSLGFNISAQVTIKNYILFLTFFIITIFSILLYFEPNGIKKRLQMAYMALAICMYFFLAAEGGIGVSPLMPNLIRRLLPVYALITLFFVSSERIKQFFENKKFRLVLILPIAIIAFYFFHGQILLIRYYVAGLWVS